MASTKDEVHGLGMGWSGGGEGGGQEGRAGRRLSQPGSTFGVPAELKGEEGD